VLEENPKHKKEKIEMPKAEKTLKGNLDVEIENYSEALNKYSDVREETTEILKKEKIKEKTDRNTEIFNEGNFINEKFEMKLEDIKVGREREP
jgi:hypothetical protein